MANFFTNYLDYLRRGTGALTGSVDRAYYGAGGGLRGFGAGLLQIPRDVYGGLRTPGSYLIPRAHAAVPNWQDLGYRSEREMLEDLYYPTNASGLPDTSGYNPAGEALSGAAGAGGAGGGGVADRWVQDPRTGEWFNLADPAQMEQWVERRRAEQEEEFNLFRGRLGRTFADRLAELDLARSQLGEQRGTYEQDVAQFLSDLLEGKQLGDVRRLNLFAAYGPQAYQSSLGTSSEFAEKKYGEARSRKEEERARNLRQFDIEEASLARQGRDFETAYNEALREAQLQKQRNIADLQSGAVGTLQEIGRLPAGFLQRLSYQGFNPQKEDLSEYVPYVNFEGIMRSPRANYFSPFLGTPQGQQSPLAQYLGYNQDLNNPFARQAGVRPWLLGYR